MTSSIVVAVIAAQSVSMVLVWFCAWQLSKRQAERDTRAVVLNEVVSDLNETIKEWGKRSAAGDAARSIELPGIHVVRRMLKDAAFHADARSVLRLEE